MGNVWMGEKGDFKRKEGIILKMDNKLCIIM